MTKPAELTTERLLLRPFRLSDVDDVFEYGSDPEWAAFASRPYTRSDAERGRGEGRAHVVEHEAHLRRSPQWPRRRRSGAGG